MFKIIGRKYKTNWRKIEALRPCFPKRKSRVCASKAEAFMVNVLKAIFTKEEIRINTRPRWLNGLELDCYMPNLGLAFEYDGDQHFMFPNIYHSTREEFEAQIARDREKDRICARHNVKLIRIRPSGNRISKILCALKDLGLLVLRDS